MTAEASFEIHQRGLDLRVLAPEDCRLVRGIAFKAGE
jgi:hypothetical protein